MAPRENQRVGMLQGTGLGLWFLSTEGKHSTPHPLFCSCTYRHRDTSSFGFLPWQLTETDKSFIKLGGKWGVYVLMKV